MYVSYITSPHIIIPLQSRFSRKGLTLMEDNTAIVAEQDDNRSDRALAESSCKMHI